VADPRLDDATNALRELILAGESYRLAAADYLGLTISESQAVSYLLARGELGQGELGAALGFNSSSTTALVDRLERNEFAERVPDPHDRRRSLIRLSQSGRDALAEVRSWMADAFADIPADDLARVTAAIATVSQGLRSTAESVPSTDDAHPKPPRRR
jgi:DNA-binding MarR family transcriptional regulator